MTTQEKTNKIKIKRVRQADLISPKLFTLAMEDMFRELNWQNKGILINDERLIHLRSSVDIILIARDQDEAQSMIEELNEKSEQIGVKINFTNI